MTELAIQTQPGSRVVDGLVVPEAGTYDIDRAHSAVEFVGRYLMVSKVRGRFGDFSGQIHIAEHPHESTAEVTVVAASIDTGDENRDGHLRSDDFLAVDRYPTLEFRSTRVEGSGDRWQLVGDLTIHGVTKPVTFDVDGALDGGASLALQSFTEICRAATRS